MASNMPSRLKKGKNEGAGVGVYEVEFEPHSLAPSGLCHSWEIITRNLYFIRLRLFMRTTLLWLCSLIKLKSTTV